jgi:hypothetical protein
MTATLSRKRATQTPKSNTLSAQQVKEALVELAYRLHATRVVKRVPESAPGERRMLVNERNL